MKLITEDEIWELLVQVCELLHKQDIDYLLYGSAAYNLLTKDKVVMNDLDIIVRQSDFSKLVTFLPILDLNPIQTPFTIHANSTVFKGKDTKPFDISFDSYEHYFQIHGIEIKNGVSLELLGSSIKVVKASDLKKIYTLGTNLEKIKEYKRKISNL